MSYLFNDTQTIDNTSSNPVPTYLVDSNHATAFSRLRVSEARLLGDYRYMYGSGTSILMNDLTALGGTLIADQARNCFIGTVTTSSGSRVVRQTKKYHPYTSGTSTLGLISFVMNPAKTNLVQAVGMFDDLNGIMFRLNGTVPELVIRKNGNDAEVVPQHEWNQGSLNYLDFSKAQILIIDYQWLGVGRVRVGFVHNGVPIYAHHFNHSNSVTEVYMNQPSLPFRWEIYNTAATASASSLMMICASAYVEGTVGINSFTKSVSTGLGAEISVAGTQGTAGVAVLAVKLADTILGKPNRSFNILKSFSIIASTDVAYKAVILPNSSKFASAPVWNSVPGHGWSQYASGVSMASDWALDNNYIVLKDGFALAATKGPAASVIVEDNPMNAIYQNYDSSDSQVLAIIAQRLQTSDSSCRASVEWLEIK